MTGWGSDIKAYEMETDDPTPVYDYEVLEWEENQDKLKLHVCSTCGLICSEIIRHAPCSLQDWWELKVKCLKEVLTENA